MRQSCIVLTLIMAAAAFAADAPKVAAPAPKPLEASDRLQIREAQLALAQAHIALLQAEAQVKDAEAQISQLIQTLKTRYACPDCTLNNDFTWTPAPKDEPEAKPSGAVTPTPEGGTNQEKE